MSIETVFVHYLESHRDGMFIANMYIAIIESRRDGMFIENGEPTNIAPVNAIRAFIPLIRGAKCL